MARYKHIDAPMEVPLGDTSPRFIVVDLERQLLPGTFEPALNYLVDHELDLSRIDARYKNDLTGAARLYRAASVWTAGLGLCRRRLARTEGSRTMHYSFANGHVLLR